MCCKGVGEKLEHFFISYDDNRGDAATKRAGRRAFMITGVVLMILGTIFLASVHGVFPGIVILGTFAHVGMMMGYTFGSVGLTLFILGLIREVKARQLTKNCTGHLLEDSQNLKSDPFYSVVTHV